MAVATSSSSCRSSDSSDSGSDWILWSCKPSGTSCKFCACGVFFTFQPPSWRFFVTLEASYNWGSAWYRFESRNGAALVSPYCSASFDTSYEDVATPEVSCLAGACFSAGSLVRACWFCHQFYQSWKLREHHWQDLSSCDYSLLEQGIAEQVGGACSKCLAGS